MSSFAREHLIHDPIHGYIPFTGTEPGKGVSERAIIDHPWVQRLRQIHQLQTAWWVFPSAEHTRFQHVLGAMHLASRAIDSLYSSLCAACEGEAIPSRGYLESTLRMAGLLHDVGHGPFGHFFDEHFLRHHGLTHETLGARIIIEELGDLLRGIRRNPYSTLASDEVLDPHQIAWLIQRPRDEPTTQSGPTPPRWLTFLRSLLSGIYTIDNLDFVLRDGYMSGYSQRTYDLDRLLHYSRFSERGLTIHDRGMEALLRFMAARGELFRTLYFHRTVRAIDLTLADLFAESRDYLFRGSPADDLTAYLHFTEFSLLVDVTRWRHSASDEQRALGVRWERLLERQIPWQMVCQRNVLFSENDPERSSIFSRPETLQRELEAELGGQFPADSLRVDIARHIYRPHTRGPAKHQNFLFDSAKQEVRALTDHQLFRYLPISQRICRVYARDLTARESIVRVLDGLLGQPTVDDLTNM